MTDASPASVAPVSLAADVADRLRIVGPTLAGRDALILPTQTRDVGTYYLADDVEAVRTARSGGLDAAFLVDQADRRYLNEFSVGWELVMALAIGQNLAADSIIAVTRYVWARAALAVQLRR